MDIRQATREDLAGVAELFDQYRIFYKQESNIDAATNYIKERLENKDSVILVAKSGDTYLGFTQLYPTFSSVAMEKMWILNDLFVSEDARNKGVAQLLLEKAKAFAKESGAIKLTLKTAKDNVSAQKLYEKLDYKQDDIFYYYELSL